MSKFTLRIPCSQQYSYIEETYEGDNPKERFDELYALMNDTGLSDFAFNDYLIRLFDSNLEEFGDINDYHEQMTDKQRSVVQAIKRMSKRTQ